MKKLIVVCLMAFSFTSCFFHAHSYLMEERGTRRLIVVTECQSFKIGQMVEEGRGLYTVIREY